MDHLCNSSSLIRRMHARLGHNDIVVYTSTERWVSAAQQNPKESQLRTHQHLTSKTRTEYANPSPFRPITQGRYETHSLTRTARVIILFILFYFHICIILGSFSQSQSLQRRH
jgi:hypothetical protein